MTASIGPESNSSLAIIGAGKVGTALGILARRAGERVAAVSSRSPESADAAVRRIGGEVLACRPGEAPRHAGLILLTVPDDQIERACEAICAEGALQPEHVVVHCSGALSSELLSPARDEFGCSVASFHPLQSFPTVDMAIQKLPGSHCFLEGDARARARLEELGNSLGVRCIEIEPEAKIRYHAAAVVACNYLSSLMDAALGLMQSAGIDNETAWAGLEPLVHATLDNISALGPQRALTGPVVRNERGTLDAHLAALENAPAGLEDLYRAMGRYTVGLAHRRGSLDDATAEELLCLFDA